MSHDRGLLSAARCIETITEHSRGLADAARAGNLRRRVEHCPEWNVGDLVAHVTEVHWLWRTIVAERLDSRPEPIRQPPRAGEDELVDVFLAGVDALTQALEDADQAASCWTWFPPQQDVAFVTRHQVQEAVVHHVDAAHAIGRPVRIADDVAVDCIEEFLTTSLADADDVVAAREQHGLELGEDVVLYATDVDRVWTIRDDGGLRWETGGIDPTVRGTAAELLLWLYGRVTLPETKPNLVRRFRRLSSTD